MHKLLQMLRQVIYELSMDNSLKIKTIVISCDKINGSEGSEVEFRELIAEDIRRCVSSIFN